MAIDQRFNRARYDARRTIDQFEAQLRQATQPERVTRDLLRVVSQTFQPESVSLWVRS